MKGNIARIIKVLEAQLNDKRLELNVMQTEQNQLIAEVLTIQEEILQQQIIQEQLINFDLSGYFKQQKLRIKALYLQISQLEQLIEKLRQEIKEIYLQKKQCLIKCHSRPS